LPFRYSSRRPSLVSFTATYSHCFSANLVLDTDAEPDGVTISSASGCLEAVEEGVSSR